MVDERLLLTEDEYTDAMFAYQKSVNPDIEKYFGNNKEEWLKVFTPQTFLTEPQKYRLKAQVAKAKPLIEKQLKEKIIAYLESYMLRATYMADPSKECWGISDYELQALKEE